MDVKIPGGVNAYVVDLRGERYVAVYSLSFPLPDPIFLILHHHSLSHSMVANLDSESSRAPHDRGNELIALIDTKQLRMSGKKHTYPLSSARSYTRTIQIIGWTPIDGSTPSRPPNLKSAYFKLRNPSSQKVRIRLLSHSLSEPANDLIWCVRVVFRVAGWFGSRNSGRDCCVESSHQCGHEIFR